MVRAGWAVAAAQDNAMAMGSREMDYFILAFGLCIIQDISHSDGMPPEILPPGGSDKEF